MLLDGHFQAFQQPAFIVRTEPSVRNLSGKAKANRYVPATTPSQYLVLLPSGNTRIIWAAEFIPAHPTTQT